MVLKDTNKSGIATQRSSEIKQINVYSSSDKGEWRRLINRGYRVYLMTSRCKLF